MEIEVTPWRGTHLMVDCFGCPQEKLGDVDFLGQVLLEFAQKVNSKARGVPCIFKYTGALADEWGITGILKFQDAHLTIHTFPDKHHAFVDIFARREIDIDAIRLDLVARLECVRHEIVQQDFTNNELKVS